MAKRGLAMEFGTDLIGKLALAVIGVVLFGLILRASARLLMRSLLLIGILTALYFGAEALWVLRR